MQGRTNTEWLRGVTRPLRSIYREVLLLSLFINFLALAVPVFSLQVYDRVIFSSGLTTLQGLVIGMVVVVAAGDAEKAVEILRDAGEPAWQIGRIVAGRQEVQYV